MNLSSWPECTLFTDTSATTLFASLFVLAAWFYYAKRSKRSRKIQLVIGDDKFLFTGNQHHIFMMRLVFVFAALCAIYSLYCMYQAGQMLSAAAIYKNAWRLRDQYESFLHRGQNYINISLFIFPLTLIPLWWDRHISKIFQYSYQQQSDSGAGIAHTNFNKERYNLFLISLSKIMGYPCIRDTKTRNVIVRPTVKNKADEILHLMSFGPEAEALIRYSIGTLATSCSQREIDLFIASIMTNIPNR